MYRDIYIRKIYDQLNVHQACGILGPRQCGKTTLAQQFSEQFTGKVHFFDLENPDDLESLKNPLRTLEFLEGLVVIDEIQRRPDLFPVLRVLCDRKKAKFLILGSASRDLIRQSSETLAGRIGYIELTPFSLTEVEDWKRLFIRGGFPKSYLARSDQASFMWREAYVQTFLERDIPNLGFLIPPNNLRRFWGMLAHLNGQQLNLNQLGSSMGLSGTTMRNYLDVLKGTFMIRILQPWHENLKKRQVKTPKMYFSDAGLLLNLLRVRNYEDLLRNPGIGSAWEGFAFEQVKNIFDLSEYECFFWRTSEGAELDLLAHINGKKIGFEFKFSDAPSKTRSMTIALKDLSLDYLYVIYPGQRRYFLKDKVEVIPITSLKKDFL